MKNYKLDIKEMTETFRAVNDAVEPNKCARLFTLADMSEMIFAHCKKLGIRIDCQARYSTTYLYIYDNDLSNGDIKNVFVECKNKKIGLEFFSIKPEKFVNVRMPKRDYDLHSSTAETFDLVKWELLK